LFGFPLVGLEFISGWIEGMEASDWIEGFISGEAGASV
jgi:hypothetical protein